MTLDALLAFLIHYRYAVIIPITVVEGPIIGVLVGFLVTRGIFDFWSAYAILVASNLLGDVLWYLAGRWGRHKFIRRFGPYIGVTDAAVSVVERQFQQGAAKPLYLGKVAHGAGSFFIVAAGLANVPFREFIGPTLIATLPKTLLFLAVGYFFGAHYREIHSGLGWLAVAVIVVLGFFLMIAARRQAASAVEAAAR